VVSSKAVLPTPPIERESAKDGDYLAKVLKERPLPSNY
jgi:hypothetical protein